MLLIEALDLVEKLHANDYPFCQIRLPPVPVQPVYNSDGKITNWQVVVFNTSTEDILTIEE